MIESECTNRDDYFLKVLDFLEFQARKFNDLAERSENLLKEIEENHGTNS